VGDFVITDDRDAGRVEAHEDGVVAGYVEYRDRSGRRVFTHTVVDPAFEGRGIGGTLARHVLDRARVDGVGVVPLCPFIRAWIERHPEYADLVVADRPD
jgi:predicted GNAT family acetyltransferase